VPADMGSDGLKDQIRDLLARRERQVKDPADLKCAAVLLPLLCKNGEWHVLLTQRTHDVEHHKGQISLPGGACEPQDESLVDTALRETYEEIGLPPDRVEVLGPLDDLYTVTDFVVTPFVGTMPHPFAYELNPREVEAVIEVPLAFLSEPAHLRVEEREYGDETFAVLFWDFGPYTIWGATARIVKGFLDLIPDQASLACK
jgi:8-oxo-dGTP pyrophosphatase MutT (NUDIX family)